MLRELGIIDNKISNGKIQDILYDNFVGDKQLTHVQKLAVKETIRDFVNSPYDKAKFVGVRTEGKLPLTESGYNKMLQLYVKARYSIKEADGITARNNEILDMMESALTNKENSHLQFNPQSFDEQKKIGYMVEAYKNSDYTWQELDAMTIDQLKDIISKDKDLTFIDVHTKFYKQNSAAASLIGIFAVNKIAHAVIENEGYAIDTSTIDMASFVLNGNRIGGLVTLDGRNSTDLMSINRTLGSLVAASADAVKDPILNLMNINITTANLLMSAVRIGLPFRDAAMLLSQKSVSDVLTEFNKENITGSRSLNSIIKDRLNEISKKDKLSISIINTEGLSMEEMIDGLKSDNIKTEFKALQILLQLSKIADIVKVPTFASRYNSITSATGPLILDNILHEYKKAELTNQEGLCKNTGTGFVPVTMYDVINSHPILGQFSKGYDLSREIFRDSPLYSTTFANMMNTLSTESGGKSILSNRKLFSNFIDFYMTYLYTKNNVVDTKEYKTILEDFPKKVLSLKQDGTYNDNKLIDAINVKSDNNGNIYLSIDLTGASTQVKEKLGAAWQDLYKRDQALALDLFKYSFFRGGIGFNPKSFINILPISMKESIQGYTTGMVARDAIDVSEIYDYFIRNNTDNNSLVPRRDKLKLKLENAEEKLFSVTGEKAVIDRLQNGDYFKQVTKDESGKETTHVYKVTAKYRETVLCEEVSALGHDKFFVEIPINGKTEISFKDEAVFKEEEAAVEETDADPTSTIENDGIDADNSLVTTIESLFRNASISFKNMTTEEALEAARRLLNANGITFTEAQLKGFIEFKNKLC